MKAKAGQTIINFFYVLQKRFYLFGIQKGFNKIEHINEVIPFYILMPENMLRQIWSFISIATDTLFAFDIIVHFLSAAEMPDGSIDHRLKPIAK